MYSYLPEISSIQSQMAMFYNFSYPNFLFIPPSLCYFEQSNVLLQNEPAILNDTQIDKKDEIPIATAQQENFSLIQNQQKERVIKTKKTINSEKQKKKSKTKVEIKQKFGRNICSNIFRMMINFVKTQTTVKDLIFKIIQSNNMNIKISEFYKIFRDKCQKLKSYTRITRLIKFWTGPISTQTSSRSVDRINSKQAQTAKIFRILGKRYLQYSHFPYLYNTVKIQSKSRKIHLEEIHRILSLK